MCSLDYLVSTFFCAKNQFAKCRLRALTEHAWQGNEQPARLKAGAQRAGAATYTPSSPQICAKNQFAKCRLRALTEHAWQGNEQPARLKAGAQRAGAAA